MTVGDFLLKQTRDPKPGVIVAIFTDTEAETLRRVANNGRRAK